ncbi:MAG: hypothetical protein CL946_00575 [Ectothiorhodospiraceae bacterium]|nr:hypothetical protein [Ectothiorhodospiraceae bacterium]
MDVFVAKEEHITADSIRLEGDEHHHLSRVMRMKPGERVLIASGAGVMYEAEIMRIDADATILRETMEYPDYNEPTARVILAQGLLKNPGKMDWIVEKATELGAAEIALLKTDHTVKKGAKVDRLQSIALAAMKQSMRCVLPVVHPPRSLEEVLDAYPGALLISCDEQLDPTFTIEGNQGYIERAAKIVVFIGPEGGFSGDETMMLQQRAARFVSLGERRLRAETAALAALARVTALLEWKEL